MRKFRGTIVAVALLAGLPCAARAVETHAGPVTITRRAEIKGLHDSNIFLTSATPFASGIAQFTHDIGFTLEQKRTKAVAGYQISVLQYDKFPGVNNAVNQTATFKLDHEPGQGSTIGVGDEFKATNDPASSELVERARRNQNDATATGETPLGPDVFVGLDGGHTLHHYLGRSLASVLNRKAFHIAPRVGFNVTAKTKIYGEVRYEQVRYDLPAGRDKDNASTSAHGVAVGEFTARLKGKVGAGVTMKKYRNSVTNMTDSVTLPSWNAALTFAAPRDVLLTLALSQGAQEGLYNRYNVSMVNMVSVSRPLSKKAHAAVFGMLITDSYPDLAPGATSTAKRADQTVQAGATLTYAARKWLSVAANVLYRARASNIDTFDYTDRVISVGVEATY